VPAQAAGLVQHECAARVVGEREVHRGRVAAAARRRNDRDAGDGQVPAHSAITGSVRRAAEIRPVRAWRCEPDKGARQGWLPSSPAFLPL
jgi:hypothetical protein